MPAFGRDLGSRNTATAGGSTTLVTTAAVAAGEDIVLWIGTDNTTATITGVTDDAGGTNTYAVVQTITSSNRRGFVVVCRGSKALATGATFTITFSASVTCKAMRATAVAGLHATLPVDGSSSGSGSSTAPSSGATAALAGSTELALGLIVTDGVTGDTFTIGGGFTGLGGVFNATTSNLAIYPAYRTPAGTAAQTYSATITSRAWAAGVVAMRGLVDAVGLRVAAQASAEVASGPGTGRAAAFVGAEVAYVPSHAAVAFVGVEVAGVFPPPPPPVALRTAVSNEVRFPW